MHGETGETSIGRVRVPQPWEALWCNETCRNVHGPGNSSSQTDQSGEIDMTIDLDQFKTGTGIGNLNRKPR